MKSYKNKSILRAYLCLLYARTMFLEILGNSEMFNFQILFFQTTFVLRICKFTFKNYIFKCLKGENTQIVVRTSLEYKLVLEIFQERW